MGDQVPTLGGFLRRSRERLAHRTGARFRQADVAEHAEITVEWYARIERGTVVPSFEVLSRIATALCLSAQERVEVLHFVLPEPLRRVRIDPVEEPPARASRELRAYRRFHRRAESASTHQELLDLAVMSLADGLPNVAFASNMSRSAPHARWLHSSAFRPDVAEAINRLAPIDDLTIQSARLEHAGLNLVGSCDYGTASIANLRDREVHTELRSGFGVRVPGTDSLLGYCPAERGEPDTDHVLLLGAIGNVVALTLRGSA